MEYLVAGGVAINLHGFGRFTLDLDLIIHLSEENIIRFDDVMTGMGFCPKVPVTGRQFAKKENREEWKRDKNMLVFSYVNPNNPLELIDVFVDEPKPFQEMFERRLEGEVMGEKVAAIGLQDLLELKLKANRPKDQMDIEWIRKKMAR